MLGPWFYVCELYCLLLFPSVYSIGTVPKAVFYIQFFSFILVFHFVFLFFFLLASVFVPSGFANTSHTAVVLHTSQNICKQNTQNFNTRPRMECAIICYKHNSMERRCIFHKTLLKYWKEKKPSLLPCFFLPFSFFCFHPPCVFFFPHLFSSLFFPIFISPFSFLKKNIFIFCLFVFT